jgi:hypothetical protein
MAATGFQDTEFLYFRIRFGERKTMMLRNLVLAGAMLCLPVSPVGAAGWTQTLKRIDDSGEINLPVESTKAGMDLLEPGQVDAFAADRVVLIGQVISSGSRKLYTVSGELFSFESLAIAVPRGDDYFQFVADRVLSVLNRSGGIVPIYGKWFGSFGEKPPAMLRALYRLHSTPLRARGGGIPLAAGESPLC